MTKDRHSRTRSAVAVAVALLALPHAFAAGTIGPVPTTTCTYVTGAKIAYRPAYLETPFEDPKQWITEWMRLNRHAATFGHDIEKGAGSVLQIRITDPAAAADATTKTQLSFEVLPARPPIDGSESDTRVLRDAYTFGAPAWINVGDFAKGKDDIVTIRMSKFSEKVRVVIEGNVTLEFAPTAMHHGELVRKRISIDCQARVVAQSQYKNSTTSPKWWEGMNADGEPDE